MLVLFLPTNALACMFGPSPSSTLAFGGLKVMIGLILLFYSFRLYGSRNKIFLNLIYILAAVTVVGSVYSVVVRYGLHYGTDCSTRYGEQTSVFIGLCLVVSVLVTITYFSKKYIAKRS